MVLPNQITPNKPVIFNSSVCTGCNKCVEVCMSDIFLPNPEKGSPPLILYPDECYYDGNCVRKCPQHDKGAIRLNWPLMQRVRWKRKETGEHFRIGMPNPPPPNTKPPVE
ncbi:MAG: ferredoxin family protein [Promethearchaeota archaeon]